MKWLLTIIMILFTAIPAWAGTITFTWDPNQENDLAGYKLHIGTLSGQYSETIDVKNVTEYSLNVPENVKRFYALSAYDTGGNESAKTPELEYTLDPPPAIPKRFKPVTVIQFSQ